MTELDLDEHDDLCWATVAVAVAVAQEKRHQ